jgi:hypothetical protein
MIGFIDDHRDVFGVGPICRVLGIASSTFYAHKSVEHEPASASERAKRDVLDKAAIRRVFDASRCRYGARKIWHALRREGRDIARCTVERLMKAMGIQGVVRGKKVVTTNPDAAQPCPDDKVNREFAADFPNQLWVSDFAYVSSWQGMVYVALVIDVFARKIVGWRVSTSMSTGFGRCCANQLRTAVPLLSSPVRGSHSRNISPERLRCGMSGRGSGRSSPGLFRAVGKQGRSPLPVLVLNR